MSTPKDATVETPDVGARVRALADEVLASTPYYLVDLDVRGRRGSQVVNLYVDGDEGVGVDDLAEISREVGFLLDVEDVCDGPYTLTVSTPGLDRPLRLHRQYKKNIGRTLLVHHRKADGSGNTDTVGQLTEIDEEALYLTPDKGKTQQISFADVHWAKVKLPW